MNSNPLIYMLLIDNQRNIDNKVICIKMLYYFYLLASMCYLFIHFEKKKKRCYDDGVGTYFNCRQGLIITD